MTNPDAPPLTEAEQARIIAAGVAALEDEEWKEDQRHTGGPGTRRRRNER